MKEFKEDFKRFLIDSKKAHLQENGEWFNIRCPFCGDSDRSDKPHLSIRIPKHDNLFYFQCFQLKCDVHKLPKYTDFISLGYHNTTLLEQYNNETINLEFNKTILDINEGIKYPNNINELCESYIKGRTGIPKSQFSFYKIVGNVIEFLKINNYLEQERIQRIINQRGYTEDNCVGFLNKGNSRLNIRKINKKEFFTLDLVVAKKMFEQHSDFEYISQDFDFTKNPVIVISESNFDRVNSISVVGESGIYITGMSILGTLGAFKRYSKRYHYVRWIIISDTDVSLDFYKYNILNKFGYRIESLEVWYNTKGKDIGDKRGPIEMIKHVLK